MQQRESWSPRTYSSSDLHSRACRYNRRKGERVAPKPEEAARAEIDRLLKVAGWQVAAVKEVNIHAHRGVAIREFPLRDGFGFVDYMLYVNGKAAGVVEAKKQGFTLSGVEIQSDKYTKGLPDGLPAWR